MNNGIVVVAIGAIIVLGLAGALYMINNQPSETDPPVSEWYQVYEEVGLIDTPDDIAVNEYTIDSKHNPFVIRNVEENMFSGELDGIFVVGGISDYTVFFEVCDDEREIYAYMEGTFQGDTLVMTIIQYEDGDFLKVTGGRHCVFVREGSTDVPVVEGFDFESLEFTNGAGVQYSPSSDLSKLDTTEFYVPPMEFVNYKNNVGIVKWDAGEGNVGYGVFIISDFYEEIIYADIGYSIGDSAYTGTVTIASDEARIITESYSIDPNSGAKSISYNNISYDVNYEYGHWDAAADLSGTWSGRIYDYDGKTLTSQPSEVKKEFSMTDDFFISVEEALIDGKTEVFVWMGCIIGDEIFITSLHDGQYASLIGIVDEVDMILSGYMDFGDSYGALHFELTRE